MSRTPIILPLLLATGLVLAEDRPEAKSAPADAEAKTQKKEGTKQLPGMSILGNQEAPKALVIVPWKSSELGDSLGISPMLDDSRQPVDREVFMRALGFYEIRSDSTRHNSATAGGRDTAAADKQDAPRPATATRRRKS